jgi:deoxyadenosine/deoxycytidine kinase
LEAIFVFYSLIMTNLFNAPRTIAVEGPLRVGKSTLAGLLAKRLKARLLVEPEDNPFLGRFYKQEPGTAFAAQMWFLMERYERLCAAKQEQGVVEQVLVTDFIFAKDKLFACLNLSDAELATYERYYEKLRGEITTPELIVYLQAKPGVLRKRLKKRAAPSERAVSEEYIERVAAAYEHFFFHYQGGSLLVVDTSEIDFVNDARHREQLLARLEQPVHGTQYFRPQG